MFAQRQGLHEFRLATTLHQKNCALVSVQSESEQPTAVTKGGYVTHLFRL